MRLKNPIGRRSLPFIASITAAVLGFAAAGGGLALTLALWSGEQPRDQIATACVLVFAGAVNVSASRGIYQRQQRSILVSAIATVALMAYLGVALSDFGELFWFHALHLVLLATLSQRIQSRAIAAA